MRPFSLSIRIASDADDITPEMPTIAAFIEWAVVA
jgi:hypothetical protein